MKQLLAIALLVATACGGATTLDAYFAEVESAAQAFDTATAPLTEGIDLDAEIEALAAGVDPSDPAQVERFLEDALTLVQTETDAVFAGAETAAIEFVERLEAIDAPSAVRAEHELTLQRGRALLVEIPETRRILNDASDLDAFADALSESAMERLSDEFTASCRDLQAIADAEGIAVDLLCG